MNSQIWIAVSIFVLLAIIKKRLTSTVYSSLCYRFYRVTLFEKMLIHQMVTGTGYKPVDDGQWNQLSLFAF